MSKSALQKMMHEMALWLFVSVFVLSGLVVAQHKIYGSPSSGNAFGQLCVNANTSKFTTENDGKPHSDYVQNCDACLSQNSFASAASKPFGLIFNQSVEPYNLDQGLEYKAEKAAVLPPLRGPPVFL